MHPRRKFCIVHGRGTKPVICRRISASDVHGTLKQDCELCGACCRVSVRVDPNSSQGRAMINKIRKNAKVLKSAGVDAERVIEHIKKEGKTPLRGYVDAGDFQGLEYLPNSACALLVPEEVLLKHNRLGKKQG